MLSSGRVPWSVLGLGDWVHCVLEQPGYQFGVIAFGLVALPNLNGGASAQCINKNVARHTINIASAISAIATPTATVVSSVLGPELPDSKL